MDGEFAAAIIAAMFLYGANMAAASLLWRAKPETPTERDRRERREARRRRDRIKLAEIEAEANKNRPPWFRGLFNGGRKAA